jgi:hypothetical protein
MSDVKKITGNDFPTFGTENYKPKYSIEKPDAEYKDPSIGRTELEFGWKPNPRVKPYWGEKGDKE